MGIAGEAPAMAVEAAAVTVEAAAMAVAVWLAGWLLPGCWLAGASGQHLETWELTPDPAPMPRGGEISSSVGVGGNHEGRLHPTGLLIR